MRTRIVVTCTIGIGIAAAILAPNAAARELPHLEPFPCDTVINMGAPRVQAVMLESYVKENPGIYSLGIYNRDGTVFLGTAQSATFGTLHGNLAAPDLGKNVTVTYKLGPGQTGTPEFEEHKIDELRISGCK